MEIPCNNCGTRFNQEIGGSTPCPKCGARATKARPRQRPTSFPPRRDERRPSNAVNDTVEEKYEATRILLVINKSGAILFAITGALVSAALFTAGARAPGIGSLLVGLVLALFSWAAAEAFQIALDIEEHLRATRQMTKEGLRRRDREVHTVDV